METEALSGSRERGRGFVIYLTASEHFSDSVVVSELAGILSDEIASTNLKVSVLYRKQTGVSHNAALSMLEAHHKVVVPANATYSSQPLILVRDILLID